MYKQLMDQAIRTVMIIAVLFSIFLFIKITIGYIYPFIIAFILAAILQPYVTYMEKNWRLPRIIATFVVLSLLFLLFIGLLFLIITEIFQGTAYILERLPAYFNSLINIIENIVEEQILPFYHSITSYFQSLDPSHQATIQDNLARFLEDIAKTGTNILQSAFFQIPEIIGFLPSLLTMLLIIFLATLLMIHDWHNLTKKLTEILPNKVLHFYLNFQQGVKKAFSGYLKAQFILIMISAILILVGLLFLGVEHALTIAFFAAVVDLLPLLGTGIIFVPWILLTFFTGNYSMTIGLSVLYIIVITVRQLIEPKILSASIGIHPLVSLIILFIAIQLWGILGVLLAPVILVLAFVLFQSGIFVKLVQFIKGS